MEISHKFQRPRLWAVIDGFRSVMFATACRKMTAITRYTPNTESGCKHYKYGISAKKLMHLPFHIVSSFNLGRNVSSLFCECSSEKDGCCYYCLTFRQPSGAEAIFRVKWIVYCQQVVFMSLVIVLIWSSSESSGLCTVSRWCLCLW